MSSWASCAHVRHMAVTWPYRVSSFAPHHHHHHHHHTAAQIDKRARQSARELRNSITYAQQQQQNPQQRRRPRQQQEQQHETCLSPSITMSFLRLPQLFSSCLLSSSPLLPRPPPLHLPLHLKLPHRPRQNPLPSLSRSMKSSPRKRVLALAISIAFAAAVATLIPLRVHRALRPLSQSSSSSIQPSDLSATTLSVPPHILTSHPARVSLPPPSSLPPSLTALHPLAPSSPHLSTLAAQPFWAPAVLAAYIRPSLLTPTLYDLFLFTAALSRRNLTATHCLVDGRRIQVNSHFDEVVMCTLHNLPNDGTSLSVAITNDHRLVASIHGKVAIAPEFFVGVRTGDLVTLSDNLGGASVRSHVRFMRAFVDEVIPPRQNASMKPPRYALCLATVIAPGAHILPDWIDHHRRLGVDHVYIFDNGARPPLHEGGLGKRKDVEILSWPWEKGQVQAFSFALLAGRGRCERMMLADVDEFVLLGLGVGDVGFDDGRRPLQEYLKGREKVGYRHVQFRNLFMGNSGHVRRPKGAIAEEFIHAQKNQPLSFGKSICSTDEDWRSARIHPCGLLAHGESPERDMTDVEKLRGRYWPIDREATPLLVHFYRRSWEEWVEKWEAGRMSILTDAIADRRRGTLDVNRPDAEYVRVNGGGTVEYTFFRDFWRRVKIKAATRVKESVVTTVMDGRRVEWVVQVEDGRK